MSTTRDVIEAGMNVEVERRLAEKMARAVPLSQGMSEIVGAITLLAKEHVALRNLVFALVGENNQLKLELAKCLKDGGTWKEARVFEKGEVTTYGGVPWVCLRAHSGSRPGLGN